MMRVWCWFFGHDLRLKLHADEAGQPGRVGYRCIRCKTWENE